MPRIARIVIPEIPHHITNRGNYKQDVFLTDRDRQFYMRLLCNESRRHGVSIAAYCFMSNHVHLVAIPNTKTAFQNGIGRVNMKYSKYFNRVFDRIGHLWQDRYWSCPLDDVHFVYSLRYVERNPVRAGLVKDAWDYPWSSASAHTGGPDPSGLLNLDWWKDFQDEKEWAALLQTEIPRRVGDLLKKHAKTGRPLGSDKFIEHLEKQLNRNLEVSPVGRPKTKS